MEKRVPNLSAGIMIAGVVLRLSAAVLICILVTAAAAYGTSFLAIGYWIPMLMFAVSGFVFHNKSYVVAGMFYAAASGAAYNYHLNDSSIFPLILFIVLGFVGLLGMSMAFAPRWVRQ